MSAVRPQESAPRTPVVILGMNRSGTKYLTYRLARAFGLTRVHCEPFSWEQGFEAVTWPQWQAALAARRPSRRGAEEHERLPVWCERPHPSAWLDGVLNRQGWHLIKLVELGRAGLVRRLSPNAVCVGVIRAPDTLLASLAGTDVQKRHVRRQWLRLRDELGLADPLPDADRWMEPGLGDCARLYATLYGRLLPAHRGSLDLALAYESVTGGQDLPPGLEDLIGRPLSPGERPGGTREALPQVGLSTKCVLPEGALDYVRGNLTEAYQGFLGAFAADGPERPAVPPSRGTR